MSFKKWSAAQGDPSQSKPADKSKAAPATVRPATEPDQKPTEVGPAKKS